MELQVLRSDKVKLHVDSANFHHMVAYALMVYNAYSQLAEKSLSFNFNV